MNPNIINTNLLFVSADSQIHTVINQMISRNVSSALVVNSNACVVGIITERDIVRKYAILELEQKWSKKIRTIMTPNVAFANLATLKEDLINLHFRLGVRHFPVLVSPEPKQENILGMVTVTDLCREYLQNERQKLATAGERCVSLIPSVSDSAKLLKKLILGLGYDVREITVHDELLPGAQQNLPLIVDVEGLDFVARDSILLTLKKYDGQVIIVSSDKPEHGALVRFCSQPGHYLVTKPVDVSYFNAVLSRSFLPSLKVS